MADWLSQFWSEIAARPSGPLALRFYLQPVMAMILAFRDGMKDARSGQPPYFWALFMDLEHRMELLRHGWRSVGKVFIMAVAMDIIYQLVVLHSLHILQTAFVATTLAIVPYLLLRGPVNRIARKRGKGKGTLPRAA